MYGCTCNNITTIHTYTAVVVAGRFVTATSTNDYTRPRDRSSLPLYNVPYIIYTDVEGRSYSKTFQTLGSARNTKDFKRFEIGEKSVLQHL